MPKISVIMPVYNTSAYLVAAVDSVLAQTFSDFELICINDGSTDNSGEILDRYVKKDARVRVITEQNMGLSEARNSGLAIAKGEYVAFADSDDYYANNFLELLLAAQKETGAEIIGCDFQKIRCAKDKLKDITKISPKHYKDALKVLLHRDNFIHFNVWNKLYKRSVIGDIRFVSGIYYEDWVFNCCVFERANSFCWIKEKLYAYRFSENSIMRSDFNEKKLADYETGIRVVEAYFKQNAPEKWETIKKTRISRTVKMMMNSARRSCNNELKTKTAQTLRHLYAENLITYQGLSLTNKLKLYRFLSIREAV